LGRGEDIPLPTEEGSEEGAVLDAVASENVA